MEITTRDIRYFLAIVHTGSLTRAADDCHVTEAALSKSISRLEGSLGLCLFERSRAGMVLTQAGIRIHQHAIQIQHTLEDTIRHAADMRSGIVGYIRVGVTRPIFDDVLSNALPSLIRKYPRVELTISLDIASSLISMLQQGILDIVFSPLTGVPHGELDVTRFGYDEFAIVARDTHPVFSTSDLQLADLLQYGWIMPPQHTKAAHWLNERFVVAGLNPPKPCIEIDYYAGDSILNLVESTDLLLLRSGRWASRNKGRSIQRIAMKELEFRRPVYVIVRRNCYWSKSMTALVESLSARVAVNAGPHKGKAHVEPASMGDPQSEAAWKE